MEMTKKDMLQVKACGLGYAEVRKPGVPENPTAISEQWHSFPASVNCHLEDFKHCKWVAPL